jgi:hypothetical protein
LGAQLGNVGSRLGQQSLALFLGLCAHIRERTFPSDRNFRTRPLRPRLLVLGLSARSVRIIEYLFGFVLARPVRRIVGYPAGGGTDIFIRLLAQSLSERLGQQFVIENRGGAASNIGTEAVLRAPADGYTLLGTHTL